MDTTIKKRLIGALVISLLLLLALPVLFSGAGRLPEARITDIPRAPEVATAPAVATPRSVESPTAAIDDIVSPRPITQPSSPETDSTAADSSSRRDSAVPSASLDESGQLEAWSVQMGSFSQATNAQGLLDRLREAGYQAYTKETPLSNGNTLTQVMVGPESNFSAVQQQKDALAEEFGLSTLVVRFQP